MKREERTHMVDLLAFSRGRITTVSAQLDDFIGVGFAVRVPEDVDDHVTGMALATGRALDDLAHQLKRFGWERVR